MIAGLSSVVAVISVALLWRGTLPADRPMMQFSVDLGPEAIRGRADNGEYLNPVISPDGSRLVFPAKAADGSEQLAIRRLDRPESPYSQVPKERSIPSFLRMGSGSDSSPARS
jgi:hypothetical protein